MIRVELPSHLRALARVKGEVTLEVDGAACVLSVLDALEARYPMLRGTIRDHATQAAAAIPAIFCVRRGFIARSAGSSVARRCDQRQRASAGRRRDRRRLTKRFRKDRVSAFTKFRQSTGI